MNDFQKFLRAEKYMYHLIKFKDYSIYGILMESMLILLFLTIIINKICNMINTFFF